MKKLLSILLLISLLLTCLTACSGENSKTDGTTTGDNTTNNPVNSVSQQKYESALSYLAAGNYTEAFKLFQELGDYSDAADHLSRFYLAPVKKTETYFWEEEIISEYTVDITYTAQGRIDKITTSNGVMVMYTYNADGNIIKEVYPEVNEETGEDCPRVNNYTYDVNGNLIKLEQIESNGAKYSYEFTYDANGNMIKEVDTDYSGNQSVSELTYDTNGNLIKIVYIGGALYNNQYTTEHTYDAEGRCVKTVHTYVYADNSVMIYTNENIYDEAGRLVKCVSTNPNGEQHTIDYTYDEDDTLIKEVEGYPDGSQDITEYFYDTNGKLIKTIYTQNTLTTITEYIYDANGKLLKEAVTYTSGDSYVPFEYFYDANGNLIKAVYSDSEGIQETFEYTYDSIGALAKVVYTSDYDSICSVEYQIVYLEIEPSEYSITGMAGEMMGYPYIYTPDDLLIPLDYAIF